MVERGEVGEGKKIRFEMIGRLGPAASLIGGWVLGAADCETADNTCHRHLEFRRGRTAGK